MLSSTFPGLGIPADPGRAAQARPRGQRIHHPPCPQGPEDTAGTATPARSRSSRSPRATARTCGWTTGPATRKDAS